jgi:hypothetical protein
MSRLPPSLERFEDAMAKLLLPPDVFSEGILDRYVHEVRAAECRRGMCGWHIACSFPERCSAKGNTEPFDLGKRI